MKKLFLKSLAIGLMALLPAMSWADCEPIATFPITYGFEQSEGFTTTVSSIYTTTNPFNSCWVNQETSGSTGRLFGVSTSQYHGGSQSLMLSDKNSGTRTLLVFPAMSFTSNKGYVISLWVNRNASGTNTEGIRVFVNTSASTTGATELGFLYRNYSKSDSKQVKAESASGWYQYEFITKLTGTVYLIFQGESEFGNATYVDDIAIDLAPSCIKPQELAVSDYDPTTATFTWSAGGSETQWQYVNVAKGATPDWANATLVSTNSVTVESLTAATEYDFYVRAYCDATDQSAVASVSYRTACALQTLPLTEGFETWSAVPTCWGKIGYASVASTNARTGSKSFYLSSSNYGLVLPEFDASLNELKVSFYYRKGSSNGTIAVGVTAEDPANITTSKVTQVDSKYCSSISYTQFTCNLSTADASKLAGKKYVVIYNTSGSFYIDDISVTKLPSKPTNLEVSSKNATSATFTFSQTDSKGKWSYEVSKSSNSWGNSDKVASGDITDKTFTASGLVSGKTYYARVKHVDPSTSEASAWSDIVSVTTDCQVTDLPFEEDFANGVTACWVKLGSGTISGYQSLSLTNAAALLPEINMGTQALSGCQLNFKMEVYSSYTPVTVKVIAAPSREASQDPSTLPVVATFDVSSATTKNCEIFLSSATSIDFTTNKYLGLYAVGSGKTVYFDNVVLKKATGMLLPENIQISEITHNSAKVTFEQQGECDEWRYQLSKNSSFSDAGEGTVVSSKTINLTGLDSRTTYYFRIRQEMDEEDHWTDPENFTTDCAPLQYSTIDFESFTASTSTSYGDSYVPSCWTSGSSSGSNSYKPFVSKYTPYSGTNYHSATNYLYMSGSSSYCSWMALPPLAANDSAKYVVMTFWARSSSSSKYTLKVGVMSDPEDQTTFTSVQEYSIGSTTYAEFTAEFNQYAGTGKYIAFMVDKNYGTFYVDDITLEYVTCAAPKEATVTNITTETATLNVGFNDKDWSWKLGENGTVNNVAAGTASADLGGLEDDKAYSVFAKTRCGGEDGESKWFQIDFRTACEAQVALGYTEDFTDGISTCMKAIKASYNQYGTKYVTMSDKAALILPTFEATTDWSALQLSFNASTNSTSAAELKVIAYDETVEDLANQDVLASVNLSSSMSGVDVYLNEIADINTKMAGKRLGLYRESVVGVSVDDIAIKAASQFKAPTNLAMTAESETAEGADFTFEQTGTPTNVWVVEVATANSFSSLVKNDTITATNFTLTGLNMKTKYYVRVKQMNGTESSNYSNVVEFTTECGFFTMGVVDNLESYTAGTSGSVSYIPSCWTSYNENGYSNYSYAYINSSPSYAHSSSKSLYLTCYTYSSSKKKTWMALPEVNATDMSLVSVKFWARNNSSYSSSTYDLEVGVMSDPTKVSTYEMIGKVSVKNSYDKEYTIQFNEYTGDKKYIVFMNNATYGTFYIDDIKVSESACAIATDAAASEITDVTAKITISNATPNWNVVVVADNDTAFAQSNIIAANVVATGLSAQTDYVAYITMNCQGGGESDPVEVKFTTPCTALTDDDVQADSVLYFQGFESGFDACETKVSSNSYPQTCASSAHVYEGSKSAEFYNCNPGALVLPPMNITWTNYQLSLYAKLWSGSNAQNIVVAASADVPALDDVKKLDTLAVFSIPDATFAQYNVQFKDVAAKLANAKYIVLYTTAGDILVDNIEIKQVVFPEVWELVRDNLSQDQIGTTCLGKNITNVRGGVLYGVNYGTTKSIEFAEKQLPIAAGDPLLFQADGTNGGKLEVVYGSATATEALKDQGKDGVNGFVGLISGASVAIEEGNILVSGGKLHLTGTGCNLTAGHAYIKTSELPTQSPAPVQGRRLVLTQNGTAVATGTDEIMINNIEGVQKIVRDGQLIIIRGGQLFNAQGQKL